AACSPLCPSARRARVTAASVFPADLFDVDVLERHHPHRRDEAGRTGPVHVPDPRVVEVQLEVAAAAVFLDLHVDGVGEIEAALGLHDVGEHLDDVVVLLVQLELDLGLVPLQIFGTHRTNSTTAVTRTPLYPPARRAGWPDPRLCCAGLLRTR